VTQIPEDDFDPEEIEPPREVEAISYFGTDFDVHGLVRRLNQSDVRIPSFDPVSDGESDLAGFQRKFVWKRLQMDRFIESLLLGFPVPDIFFVQQSDKSLLVLDGQQRLTTMQKFYAGNFALESVVDVFKGLTYQTLDDEQRRSLDNFFIHATVIRYTASPAGAESIYSIFERLNAGGTNLHPHEIRVALYNGPLVELLRDLNRIPSWRNLYGPANPRLKDQEQILRFIALYLNASGYQRPLKSFLNRFIFDNREMKALDATVLTDVFTRTCDVLDAGLGRSAFRLTTSINSALADAVMVGVARRLEKGPIKKPDKLRPAFERLTVDQRFKDSVARATADEARVDFRLTEATKAFSKV